MRLFQHLLGRVLLGVTLSFLSIQGFALNLPKGVSKVTEVEGITEYRLDNGLRVLFAPDESKPTTTVNMTYLVGSRHENYGQTGMAHLLEHMLFKGTPTTRNALGEFSKRGLRSNGSTSTDRTNYFASFAANPENLEWFLGWQADAMVNSLIAREDLDTEMTVVRNEMENGENNPFQILWQKMLATAFQYHNYGKTPIGARSDVEGVDIAQLQAFYRLYYQPDNAVLVVSGKFDLQKTLDIIARDFGKIPRPTRERPIEYTIEPVQDGERSVVIRRVGGSPLVAAMYHIPAATHRDFAAMDLASMMMADTPAGRLYKAMVPTKLAAGVFGFTLDQFAPGTVMFGGQLQPGMDQSKSLETLTSTIESIAKQPFTQEELDRVKNQWLTAWEQTFSDAQKVGTALSESIALGDWRMFFLQRDRIKAVTLEDVQRVAQAYFVPSNRTSGLYIPTEQPQRAPAPTPTELDAALKDYKGNTQQQQVASFDPTPANIDAKTKQETLSLPSGQLKMALLPKDARGERVQAKVLLRFGSVDTLKGQRINSSTVASLLTRGTDKLSRQQIRDRIDALKGQVSISGSGTSLSISLSTTKPHFNDLLALVMDVVRHANFPQDQIDEYVRQSVTQIKSAMTEPTSIASRTLARLDNPWAKDDIRYIPSFEESLSDIEKVKREDLVAFHQKFYGGGHIAFTAVGDFDAAQAQKTIEQSLAGWKTGMSFTRVPDPYRAIAPQQLTVNTPDKANAFYIASLPLKLQDTDPDFPALLMANYLLGSSETSRLWTRIREKEGLSYNVRSTLDASSFEPSGSWSMVAIYAPENRQRLETAMREELERFVAQGVSAEELKNGIQSYLNLRKLSRAQDSVLAAGWLNYLETDRTFAWSEKIDQALAALTVEQVNAAIRKYLQPQQFSSVAAGDFEKKKK